MQVRVLDATVGASGIHRHDRSDTQILDKAIELQWWKMRVQTVGLLHKFRVEYAESVVVKIGTWVSVLNLRDSLWVPEAAEVKPDETGSVVPGTTNISWVVQGNEDKEHEDLVCRRVAGRPLRGVENDALHDVTDLKRVERWGGDMQVLICHNGAVQLEAQVMEKGGMVEPQGQLFEPNLGHSRRSRREASVQERERKVEAPYDVCEYGRRYEPLGICERIRGGADPNGLQSCEGDIGWCEIGYGQEIRTVVGNVSVEYGGEGFRLARILASTEVRGIGYAALERLGRLREDTEIVFRQGVRKHGKLNLEASCLCGKSSTSVLEDTSENGLRMYPYFLFEYRNVKEPCMSFYK
ncbi:hypothetical protein B0H13DRAFT_1879638 [Mycena leptocephala]|nr:hypothetical protein B0H13DRAFT_1879638 [Mycena leptocephala]